MGFWIPITLSKALGFESHVLHAVVTVVALLCSLMCQLDISSSKHSRDNIKPQKEILVWKGESWCCGTRAVRKAWC